MSVAESPKTVIADAHRAQVPKLPRRDFIFIPLLSIVTVVCMFAAAEFVTRATWPEQTEDICVHKDQFGVLRAQPNCTSTTKIPEGPAVTYHFNACGYRTSDSCGPKPAGTLRIVMLGSSITEGLHVPYQETFAERTARALAKATGRNVQIENMGLATLSPLNCYHKVDEAIALKPDFVVYAVAPFDLDQAMDPVQLANRNNPQVAVTGPLAHYSKPTLLKTLQRELNDSRTFLVAQHFLFSNTQTFLRIYLAYGDKADYLRQPVSPRWQARYADFDLVLTDMAARFREAGIPLLLMAVPSRPEAALLSVKDPPPHTDGYSFDRTLQAMAAKLNIGYVDGIREFAATPHSDQLFYIVESHITGAGHALLARALVRKYLDEMRSN
jgi:hypothetical protein